MFASVVFFEGIRGVIVHLIEVFLIVMIYIMYISVYNNNRLCLML
jgi:hypothetical protein